MPAPVNLAPNPSFETASGNVVVRQNLFPIPQLAAANGTIAGASFSTLTGGDLPLGVGQGWRSTYTSDQASSGIDTTVNATTTVTGRKVLSIYVRSSVAHSVILSPVAAGSAGAVSVDANPVLLTANVWTRLYYIGDFPATGPVGIRVRNSGVVSMLTGATFDATAAMVEDSPILQPYFDGSTPVKVRRNLAWKTKGSGCSPNGVGWIPRGGAGFSTDTEVTTTGPFGADILALRRVFTSSVTVSDRGFENSNYPAPFPVTIGQTYTLSGYLRSSVSGIQFQAQAMRMSAPSTGGPFTLGPTVVSVAGQWHRISVTFVADLPYVQLISNTIGGPDWQIGGVLEGTALLLEVGSSVGDFFDGAMNVAPYVGAWEGAANNSPSYLKDPDFTVTWVSLVNQSASIQTGVKPTGMTVVGSAPVQSTHWVLSGSKSLRLIRTVLGDSYTTPAPYPGSNVGGKAWTLIVRSRVPAPLATEGNMHVYELNPPYREMAMLIPNGTVLNGVREWRVTFTTPANIGVSGFTSDFRTGASVGDSVWYDSLALYEGAQTPEEYYGSIGATNADLELAYLKKLGAAGPSLEDAREQIHGPSDHAYFAALSGLTPASVYRLSDHQMAYYKTQTGAVGSLADVSRAFWMMNL